MTPDTSKKRYRFRASALAEYEWNAKGRTEAEFAEAWAVRQGYSDPELFTEWVRMIHLPVNQRMAQAWGGTVQQTWLGRLPKQIVVGDFNVSGADTPEQNVTVARHTLALAEKIGDPSLVLASRTLMAYCALEASGYAWVRQNADKTKTVSTDQPSQKKLRGQLTVALQDYIAARQTEIKELKLGYREKTALAGSAPLEELVERLE